MTPIKYEKNNMVAYLQETQYEGAGYSWTPCLALLSDTGQWMISCHWRTNHYKKAKAYVESLGWKEVKQ